MFGTLQLLNKFLLNEQINFTPCRTCQNAPLGKAIAAA